MTMSSTPASTITPTNPTAPAAPSTSSLNNMPSAAQAPAIPTPSNAAPSTSLQQQQQQQIYQQQQQQNKRQLTLSVCSDHFANFFTLFSCTLINFPEIILFEFSDNAYIFFSFFSVNKCLQLMRCSEMLIESVEQRRLLSQASWLVHEVTS